MTARTQRPKAGMFGCCTPQRLRRFRQAPRHGLISHTHRRRRCSFPVARSRRVDRGRIPWCAGILTALAAIGQAAVPTSFVVLASIRAWPRRCRAGQPSGSSPSSRSSQRVHLRFSKGPGVPGPSVFFNSPSRPFHPCRRRRPASPDSPSSATRRPSLR